MFPHRFHALQPYSSRSILFPSDSQITAQIRVLNEDYAPSGISFVLANTTRTTNANWFNRASLYSDGLSYQTAMKRALRTGGAADLNVYTVGFATGQGQGLLGYATFPSSYQSNPTDDGVVFLYSTVPGGSFDPYNLGRTLTHEAGHWFGLYHTFQGGCSSTGDSVSDTPAEESEAYGCQVGRDTCPGGGVDPIHNYMDYSDDEYVSLACSLPLPRFADANTLTRCLFSNSCMTEFTPGQATRMAGQVRTYRGISI